MMGVQVPKYKIVTCWSNAGEYRSFARFFWRSKKPLKLTVAGQVKFAVVKDNKAFVIDEEGKERELSIISMKTKQTGH